MSTPPPRPISTEGDALPARPGLAKAIGVAHIVIATLSGLYALISLVWVAILAGSRATSGTSPAMMGMDDPGFLVFTLVDAVSILIIDGLIFASGVSLINLRSWGARVWRWLAPVMIARAVVVWGGFIVAVAPPFSRSMGQAVAKMIQQQAPRRALLQNANPLSLVYAWMFLATGLAMIVVGSLYPAASWWLVRRRGVQAALEQLRIDPTAPGKGDSLECR